MSTATWTVAQAKAKFSEVSIGQSQMAPRPSLATAIGRQ